MTDRSSQSGRFPVKVVVLALLAPLCLWLVYRNLLHPGGPPSGVLPGVHEPASQPATPQGSPAGMAAAPGHQAGGHDPAPGASADPTLRLDLLKAARSVEYKGSSRNIFQAYVPPPPPAPAPVHASTAPGHPAGGAPAAPAAPVIPLKFYGTAQSPGSSRLKAFFTDGEDSIYVAQEGDLVAKFYRVTRVGIASVEVEDTRTHARQQLPLIEN